MVKGEGFPGNGNVGSKFLLGSLVIPLVYNMLEFTIGYVNGHLDNVDSSCSI